MKLIKGESPYTVWYFTNKAQIAHYFGMFETNVCSYLKLGKPIKGHIFEEVDEDVLPQYINPFDKGITYESFLCDMEERYKRLFKSIVEGKDIKGDY